MKRIIWFLFISMGLISCGGIEAEIGMAAVNDASNIASAEILFSIVGGEKKDGEFLRS